MNKNVKKLAFTGMFAALIFVFTMFVKIPVIGGSGYVHFGDALVYLCSLILGPWAILAGAVGEGLADVAGGYVAYAPATVVIKSLIAVPFVIVWAKNKDTKLFSLKNALMTIVSGIITVSGYYAADLIIDKKFAIADLPGNIIQAVGSAVIFVLLALALDKVKIKNKIKL